MNLPKTRAASNVLSRRISEISDYLSDERRKRFCEIFEQDDELPELSAACRVDSSAFDPEAIAALRTYLPEINNLVRQESETDDRRASEIDALIANLPDVPAGE